MMQERYSNRHYDAGYVLPQSLDKVRQPVFCARAMEHIAKRAVWHAVPKHTEFSSSPFGSKFMTTEFGVSGETMVAHVTKETLLSICEDIFYQLKDLGGRVYIHVSFDQQVGYCHMPHGIPTNVVKAVFDVGYAESDYFEIVSIYPARP